ncbi:MAG: hypothetical protein U0175_11815 [Caldilineaceae bacterium]
MNQQRFHFYSILALMGNALLVLVVLGWLLQHSVPQALRAQNVANPERHTNAPALLAIYALAFDNLPGSPTSLAAYYTPTLQSIVSATANAADRVAVILVDLDGYGDTRIIIAQNGVAVPVDGLPRAENLASPVTLHSDLNEYDMADGWLIGNFIHWARQLYPAPTTIFSYVGHGAPLTPQLAALNEGSPDVSPTPTPPGTPTPTNEPTNPLPPRWGAHTDLTDYHSASLLSVRSLAQALDLGTDHGSNPLTVVDLLHCFSATIEELYEVHPYAQTIIAAPNYAYAKPTMLGATLAELDTAQSAAELAQAIVASYDQQLPIEEHPRLFIALDAAKIAPIKQEWDHASTQLLAAFATAEPATRTRLLAAYQASAKYDTTICSPQDWQLAPPDALSDMADFATQLADQFGSESAIGSWALSATQTISNAILARYVHEGSPWFADTTPLPQWHFPGAGIALYTDFDPPSVAGKLRYSWQAPWYTHTVSTTNPYPYAFIRPQQPGEMTWADLLSRFWREPITSTTGCIPGFVNGRGSGELSLSSLSLISNNLNSTLLFSVTVSSSENATNPLLRFRVYSADLLTPTQRFESVIGSGYFEGPITRTVQSLTAWQPQRTGTYSVEATIDLDNRFIEANEGDNTISMTLSITVPMVIYLPLVEK